MQQNTQNKKSLAVLREQPVAPLLAVKAGFDTAAGFDLIQRVAKVFSLSDIAPKQFQGHHSNCIIAVDMALRMGANPLMVCQNLYIVNGRPAWSAQFLIATINQSGRFSPLRYEFQGAQGADDWGCRASAKDLSTGERLVGPLITIKMAKDEQWMDKPHSKWKTMPELMLQYRAASWFVRAYAPEIAMGLHTAEEIQDTYDVTPDQEGSYQVSIQEMKDATQAQGQQSEIVEKKGSSLEKTSRVPLDEKRKEAIATWESTGNPLEDAERLVNAFANQWNSAQCEKVKAHAATVSESGAKPAD